MDFIKVAAACPMTRVADIDYNLENILICLDEAYKNGAKSIVFPELAITSYTCSDLFMQYSLLEKANLAIEKLIKKSAGLDMLIAIGAPLSFKNVLFNCAYIIFDGKLLGIVPKSYIPNYSEFYEKRWFSEGLGIIDEKVDFTFQKDVPFGTNLIFTSGRYSFGFEICEDLWVTIPPSSYLSLLGANIIGNLSASNELVSKKDYREALISNQSARCMSAYIYSSAGVHESTTDLLFSGHMLIAENGTMLKENERFQRNNEVIYSCIDVFRLNSERLKNISFRDASRIVPFEAEVINFNYMNTTIDNFDRFIDKHPFVPSNAKLREERCKEIFSIQAAALAKRMEHTNLKKAVIGISSGLDSTLALLVVVKTFELLG